MRDPRWENVSAYMGVRKEYRGDEFEMGVDISQWFTIEIEVRYNDWIFWKYNDIHKDDIKDFKFDVLSWLLNKMVEMIDESIVQAFGEDHYPWCMINKGCNCQ